MSIVTSVKVRDGIVLGADGASQIHGQTPDGQVGVVKVWYNAQKIFQIADLNVGVLTYGTGNIGPRSVQGVLQDFSDAVGTGEIEHPGTVKGLAEELSEFLQSSHEQELPETPREEWPDLGIFVAGYSAGKPHGEEYEFAIPAQTEPEPVRSANDFGASWRGVGRPFQRLFKGFDRNLHESLLRATDEDSHGNLAEMLRQQEARVQFDSMPLQDAAHFAEFVVETTIRLEHFELGAPQCGGPINLGLLTRDEFRWLTEPRVEAPEGRGVRLHRPE